MEIKWLFDDGLISAAKFGTNWLSLANEKVRLQAKVIPNLHKESKSFDDNSSTDEMCSIRQCK